jgi:hypothetical protein
MTTALIDNDVILKSVQFRIIDEILALPLTKDHAYGILGQAKFVLSKLLKKRPPSRGAESALADLESALAEFHTLEPTKDELELAAALEFEAQQLDLPFHTGESQLCAILLLRGLHHLLTGDKKAIGSAEQLLLKKKISDAIRQKLVSFEQLMLLLLQQKKIEEVRILVCMEKEADRTISSCFSCSSPEVPASACHEGLLSYLKSLKAEAENVLMPVV